MSRAEKIVKLALELQAELRASECAMGLVIHAKSDTAWNVFDDFATLVHDYLDGSQIEVRNLTSDGRVSVQRTTRPPKWPVLHEG